MRHSKQRIFLRWFLLISICGILATAIYTFARPHFLYPEHYARHVFDQIALPERTVPVGVEETTYLSQKTWPWLRCSGQAIRLTRGYRTDLQVDEFVRFYDTFFWNNGWYSSNRPSNIEHMRFWRSLSTLLTPKSQIRVALHIWSSGQGQIIYQMQLEYMPIHFTCSD